MFFDWSVAKRRDLLFYREAEESAVLTAAMVGIRLQSGELRAGFLVVGRELEQALQGFDRALRITDSALDHRQVPGCARVPRIMRGDPG